jgi:hypothetical protein
MYAKDRGEFNQLLEKLYAGFNMPISDARLSAYWDGLAKMSLGQFAVAVEQALGPNGPERIPSVPAIWKISKDYRKPAPVQQMDMGPVQSKGLRLVNGLFLQFLAKRRLKENFKGNLQIEKRRKECIDLADWYDQCEKEKLTPSFPELQRAFDSAMQREYDETRMPA